MAIPIRSAAILLRIAVIAAASTFLMATGIAVESWAVRAPKTAPVEKTVLPIAGPKFAAPQSKKNQPDNRAVTKSASTTRGANAGKVGKNANQAGRAKTWKSKAAHKKIEPPRYVWKKDLDKALMAVLEISVKVNIESADDLGRWASDLVQDSVAMRAPHIPPEQHAILEGLPLIQDDSYALDENQAKAFVDAVKTVRDALNQGQASGQYGSTSSIHSVEPISIKENELRAIKQIMPAEHQKVRRIFVERFATIEGEEFSKTLAWIAATDSSGYNRYLATKALRNRPSKEYQDLLIKYLHHPQSELAENASEALKLLKLKSAVPALIESLQSPDLTLPRMAKIKTYKSGKKKDDTRPRLVSAGVVRQLAVPQVVRMNHLKNCVLCHPPIAADNKNLRSFVDRPIFPIGSVPSPKRPLPSQLGYWNSDLFVRAEVTYLRQDFSAMLPVEKPGRWPKVQRFDFVVRMVPVNDKEASRLYWRYLEHGPSRQRQLLLFLLRRLTGQNLGRTYEDWAPLLKK